MPNDLVRNTNLKLAQWNNDDNCNFYESIGRTLQEWAITGGLENGCDIEIIYPRIADKTSIMELGASYGRAIRNILRRNYKGKLYAIERSMSFYNQLLTQFGNKSVDIIHADVKTFTLNIKVDVILMLWSFISEFPKCDQLPILKKITSWLNPGGIVVLETIFHALAPSNANFSKDQNYIIPFEHSNCYGYATSPQETEEYAKQLGAKNITHINYKTDTQRDRVLHILSW